MITKEKALESGSKAYKEGKPITANPLLYSSNVGASAWWQAGWMNERAKSNSATDSND